MALSRAGVKTIIRNLLGTSADDPLYGDTSTGVSPLLDPIVQEVVNSLVGEIHEHNPWFLSKTVTLLADSVATRTYIFSAQSAPVIDFSKWLEVRYTDADGSTLDECRLEELRDFGGGYFAIHGPDEDLVLELSSSDAPSVPLFFRYANWPADLADDNAAIPGIPSRYHDVVAYEALFAFAIGGESRWPPELRERWTNRRAQLFAHIGKRGVQPSRTRLAPGSYL